jgi:hypothetical protein
MAWCILLIILTQRLSLRVPSFLFQIANVKSGSDANVDDKHIIGADGKELLYLNDELVSGVASYSESGDKWTYSGISITYENGVIRIKGAGYDITIDDRAAGTGTPSSILRLDLENPAISEDDPTTPDNDNDPTNNLADFNPFGLN